jgi:predicted ATPase
MSFREKTPFFGRETELERLGTFFENGARLVTITGPPGIGKTRLSRHFAQAARNSHNDPHDDVLLVEVSGSRTQEDFLFSMADALGIPLQRGEKGENSADVLARALHSRETLLLVLDNFEQIAEIGGEMLGRWLDKTSDVSFLITSRSPLCLSGERCLSLTALDKADSMALFLAIAIRAKKDFQPTLAEKGEINELIRRLDHLPLAIELAASRISVMSPAQMLVHLNNRFPLLPDKLKDNSNRQETLEKALDWSWELLSAPEQSVMAQIAVFRNSFRLQAAEAIVELIAGSLLLDILEALNKKSLLCTERSTQGKVRFRMFESIREYANRRLTEASDVNPAEKHTAYFLSEAESRLTDFGVPGGSDLDWFVQEWDDLIEVHERCRHADTVRAHRMLLCLSNVMLRRGPFDTHLNLLDQALTVRPHPDTSALRIRLIFARGVARSLIGQWPGAESDFGQVQKQAKDQGLSILLAKVALRRGLGFLRLGKLSDAMSWFTVSRGQAVQIGERRVATRALAFLGMCHEAKGSFKEAEACYTEALAEATAQSDRWEMARTRSKLGTLCSFVGERQNEAREHLEWALSESRKVGDRIIGLGSKYNLGRLEMNSGRLAEARHHLAASRQGFQQLNDLNSAGFAEMSLGLVELELGHPAQATAYLLQASQALEALKNPLAQSFSLSSLALAQWQNGSLAQATASTETAIVLASSRKHAFLEGLGWCVQGFVAAVQSQEANWIAACTRAQEALRDSGWEEGLALLSLLEQATDSPAPSASNFIRVRIARRLLCEQPAAPCPPGSAEDTILIDPLGRWFQVPGKEVVDLSRKRTIRPFLLAFARLHFERPGSTLNLAEIAEAAWPGERMLAEAMKNRIYVTIATLRRMGLKDVLVTQVNGYGFLEGSRVRWAGEDP